jgi:hypothetical protein
MQSYKWHMREGLVVSGFKYIAKGETLNEWRCLDEENKMDEKYRWKNNQPK